MIDRIKRNVRWLIVTAVVTVAVATLAWALFATRQDIASNVSVGEAHAVVWTPASNLISLSDMAPGDTIYGLAIGVRSSPGTPSVDILALATNADGLGLRDQLVLTIRDHLNQSLWCDAVNFMGTGTTIYTGNVGGDPEVALITNGAMVPDPTDTQNFCFRLELPADTDSAFAGASTDITIGFAVHD